MGMIQEDEEEAEVSMSPLIDCVFLLLIFFLVSTMTRKEDKDINIDLPQSTSAAEKIPDDKMLVIGVSKEGEIFVEGVPTTLTQLHFDLRELSIKDPERFIRLDADGDTPLHEVVEVLDLCQFNNLPNVNIRTYDEHYNQK